MVDVRVTREGEKLLKFITNRQQYLEQERSAWEGLWQDITDYIVPVRKNLLGDRQEGQSQGGKVFDGSAIAAKDLFVDGFHGHLVSPSFKWFDLRMEREELNDVFAVKEWLQEVVFLLYSKFQNSNFYNEMRAYIDDGATIGTATMFIDEEVSTGRLNFRTVHPGQMYIADDHRGNVDVNHRKFNMTARQLVQRFGEKAVPREVREAMENNPFVEFEVIHAVYPREDLEMGKLDAVNKPIASVWVLNKKGKSEDSAVLKVSGFDSDPYASWRYSKSGWETYGRSPAALALYDIIGLNLIGKDTLRAAEMVVNPAYNVPVEMKGRIRTPIKPGSINWYEDPKAIASPVTTGINYPVGVEHQERMQEIIRQHFRVDYFLMLAQAEKQMTATEIIERQGEKAAVLGAAVGRFNSEALNEVIERVYQVELRAGRLPPPPPQVAEMEGANMRVVYLGPLAQAQRRFLQVQSIRSGLEIAFPLIQAKPELADIVDWDSTLRMILDSSGFPAKALNSNEEVGRKREARQEARQGMEAVEGAETSADIAQKLAKADKDTEGQMSKALQQMVTGGKA